MWLSNTATTMMMFPIAASVIHVMNENNKGEGRLDNFSLTLMLTIAYSSNFGGIATIIGTPPNVAFAGFIQKKYGYAIGFADWMMVCFPLSLILLFTLYWVMVKWMYPNRIASNAGTVEMIHTEIHKLGAMSTAEKRGHGNLCTYGFFMDHQRPDKYFWPNKA
jgi:sodium-dependent dicarboxylate transporter 2/3/5